VFEHVVSPASCFWAERSPTTAPQRARKPGLVSGFAEQDSKYFAQKAEIGLEAQPMHHFGGMA
jgi:hypothetical protein